MRPLKADQKSLVSQAFSSILINSASMVTLLVTLCLGYENNDIFNLVKSVLSDVLYLIGVFLFKQLEEAERKRIEDLKEKERQKVTKELELWKNQQKDGDKYKSIQAKEELHQEKEPLKERKNEKMSKTQIPNEGSSKTRLRSTRGCIIELYFVIP